MPTTLEPTLVKLNTSQWVPATIMQHSDVEMARDDKAVRPDMSWEHIDAAGHFHCFASDGSLPTLTHQYEDVACDGSCGGLCETGGMMQVHMWTCVICNERIEPMWTPDNRTREFGVPIDKGSHWTVEFKVDSYIFGVPLRDVVQWSRVTVKAKLPHADGSGHLHMFGPMWVVRNNFTIGVNSIIDMELSGSLHVRK